MTILDFTGPAGAAAHRMGTPDRVAEHPIPETPGRAVGDILNGRIIIVDDEPEAASTLRKQLQDAGYRSFFTISEPLAALGGILHEQPDLVLLDVRMPTISGLDILERMRKHDQVHFTPVILLTEHSDTETKNQALSLGATDLLTKPPDPVELALRVRNALLVKAHHDHVAHYADELERMIQLRLAELVESRREVIRCLARAAEYRDTDTGNHTARVGRYVGIIAREMGFLEDHAQLLEEAAILHDIGKIGVPDEILLKPGKLTPEEYQLLKKHCGFGKNIIQPMPESEWDILKTHTDIAGRILGSPKSLLLSIAATIAQTHHERWNGTGYPLGLAGEDIPIEGRITAVADVYDALSSRRPYKEPLPRDKCFDILDGGRNSQFDPRVLDAFFARKDEIIGVQICFADVV